MNLRNPITSERLFWLFLAVYVAVLPVSSTVALRYLAFVGLLGTTLWALARRQIRPRFPAAGAWALYAAVALISVTTAVDPDYSIGQIRAEILYGAAVVAMAASRIDDIGRFRRLAWLLAACNAAMVGYTFYLAAITPHAATVMIGSINAKAGSYATYLVTVAPVLFFLAWDARRAGRANAFRLVCLLVAANVIALYFTANRQGVVVYAVELAIVGSLALRRAFTWARLGALTAAVAAIGVLFVVQHQKRHEVIDPQLRESTEEVTTLEGDPRWRLWRYATGEIVRQPWTGAGFGRGAFRKAHDDFSRTDAILWHAHNMLLNKGIQMGVPGIAAFLLIWFCLARAVWHGSRAGGDAALVACAATLLAGVFLKNMTDDFFVQDNALMFWLLSAAAVTALKRTAESNGD